MHSIFRKVIAVNESMLDRNGHVNNVVFVNWMQDIAVEHALENGCTHELCQHLNAYWVARSHHIDYLRPAMPGDIVVANTWIASARRVACRRKYEFLRKSEPVESGSQSESPLDQPVNDVLARGETTWVFVDATTGKPRHIDDRVSDCFQLLGDSPLMKNLD